MRQLALFLKNRNLAFLVLAHEFCYIDKKAVYMQKIFLLIMLLASLSILTACSASTSSPIGVSCDPSVPEMERPLICQGR
jgi:hypothetical protein